MLRNTVVFVSFNGDDRTGKNTRILTGQLSLGLATMQELNFIRWFLLKSKKNCNGNVLLLLYKESRSQYTRF